MSRARGANALMALAFELTYGISPAAAGYFQVPFVSSQLGEQQDLVQSNLLGQGRDPAAPSLDVINNTGDIVVPVDVRNSGLWLKGFFGAPTTTQGTPARGTVVFSGQPTAADTLTINGKAFSFVASGPSSTNILIGSTLADTIKNTVLTLNGSADAGVTPASYSANLDGVTIDVTHDTIGTAGNSFTLAKSSTALTVSGATLASGATSGPYNHVFASGGASVPSMSVEIANPEVPAYAMNFGGVVSKIAVALQRSGLLDMTVSMICQGEQAIAGSSGAGTPTVLLLERFTQFSGSVSRQGVPLGDLVSGSFTLDNGLDPVEVIRQDGRIAGVDAGEASYQLETVLRFKDTELLTLATNGTPVDLTFSWKISNSKSLQFVFHEVYLPRPKRPISGPAGIQMTFSGQAAKNATVGRAVTATLVNDKTSY